MTLDPRSREHTAHEGRLWVRLTRVCNNRCLFCLDSGAQDGTRIPEDEVLEIMTQGREQGAQRLILSGGEPTLHPKFLSFVARGRKLGYSWVQTISNGRMFAYKKFTREATAAGLSEVTLSLPAHEPGLFDELVGVPGAFKQSLAGLRNALAQPKLVVSVDVVLNRLNIPYLPKILEFYLQEGVREFDLLQIVPFGRAYDPAKPNRGRMIYDPRKEAEPLRRALRVVDRPDVVVWTNRLDPHYLEGFEKWIQDPHKLADEVRGRRQALTRFARGEAMECRAEDRCQLCFLRRYCRDLQHARKLLRPDVPQSETGPLWFRLGSLEEGERLGRALEKARARGRTHLQPSPPPPHIIVVAQSFSQARELLLRFHKHPPHPVFENDASLSPRPLRWLLELEGSAKRRTGGLREMVEAGELGPYPLEGVTLHRGPDLEEALKASSLPRGFLLAVGLNRETAPVMRRHFGGPGRQETTLKLRVFLEERLRLSESLDEVKGDVDPQEFFCALQNGSEPLSVQAQDIPPCLTCVSAVIQGPTFIDASVLDEQGELDPQRFVDFHIRRGYRVYSLRCAECVHRPHCPGAPIQLIRHFGLGLLEPVVA